MRGVINRTTIQDRTRAICYKTAANKAEWVGAYENISKGFYAFVQRSTLFSYYNSNTISQPTDYIANQFFQLCLLSKRIKTLNLNSSPQKLNNIEEKKQKKPSKGFLNILKKPGNELVITPKNNQKKGLNYCTEQLQNDLLLMCLTRVHKEAFSIAKQEAVDESYPVLKTLSCTGITWNSTRTNNKTNHYFFCTNNDSLINTKGEAAKWSFKLSSNYYFSGKPILKKSLEPPSH